MLKKQASKSKLKVLLQNLNPQEKLYLFALLVVLMVLGVQSLLTKTKSENAVTASQNNLLLGEEARTQENLYIPVNQLIDLTGRVKSEIEEARAQLLQAQTDLLESEYKLSDDVYGNISWGAAWLTNRQLFYYGNLPLEKLPDDNQVSVSSQSMVNPLLLVQPYFWGLSAWNEQGANVWDYKRLDAETLNRADFPYAPTPQSISFSPFQRQGSADYHLSDFIEAQSQYLDMEKGLQKNNIQIGISALNARDLGFKYMALDQTNSENIAFIKPKSDINPISDRYEWLDLPWMGNDVLNFEYPQLGEYINIKIANLPAKLAISLWKEQPQEGKNADLVYSLNFN